MNNVEMPDGERVPNQGATNINFNGGIRKGELPQGNDSPDINLGEFRIASPLPRESAFANGMILWITQAIANGFNAKTGWAETLLSRGLEDDREQLAKLEKHPAESRIQAGVRHVRSLGVEFAGLCVAIVAAGAWIRWIILNTNDPLLASLLASMIPVTAIGLHYWVWRSRDRGRDRALAFVTAGLALSGVGLLIAVAQRFGIDAPINGDLRSLLTGDDNRWLMITSDLVGVCGSVLLMAWGDDIGKSSAERIRLRIASREAELLKIRSRRRLAVDRAMKRAFRNLLKG